MKLEYEGRLGPGVAASSVRAHFLAWARRHGARADGEVGEDRAGVRLILHPACRGVVLGFDAQGVCRGELDTTEIGAGYHQAVVRALDELRRNFAPDLTVRDSTGYWETRRRSALVEPMVRRTAFTLERALANWPDDPTARLRTPVGEFDRAAVSEWLGDLRARRRLYARFLWWEEEREGGYWTNLGCVLYFNRFLQGAPGPGAQRARSDVRRHLERGRAEGCETWLSRYYQGLIDQEEDRLDAAASWFEEALDLRPGQPDVLLALGEARQESGALDAAVKVYTRAVEAQPAWAEASFRLGLALNMRGDRREAVLHLDRAAELAPGMAAAWVEKGLALRNLGEMDAALKCHEKGTELSPSNPNAWYARGVTLIRMKRAGEAIVCLERCLELDASHYDAMIELGLAQWIEGEQGEAERVFKRASMLKPDRPEAFFNLGQLYGSTGREAQSRQALQEAERRGMRAEDQ